MIQTIIFISTIYIASSNRLLQQWVPPYIPGQGQPPPQNHGSNPQIPAQINPNPQQWVPPTLPNQQLPIPQFPVQTPEPREPIVLPYSNQQIVPNQQLQQTRPTPKFPQLTPEPIETIAPNQQAPPQQYYNPGRIRSTPWVPTRFNNIPSGAEPTEPTESAKQELYNHCYGHLIVFIIFYTIKILKQIFRIVQTNLFRSLPDSFIINEFQSIENPPKYTLPKWIHLQFIYELMFQNIMNKQIDKKILCKYLSGSFLNNFIQLFHSLCIAEVDYVKILIHSMYLDFVDLRDENHEIRISLSQYCWDFIYCGNGTSDGINAILDIMNSILQGLDSDKLNDPNKWYIVLCHVLCPLHKGKDFTKFEQTLYKCIKTFIKCEPEHFVVVFNHGLLKFWPLFEKLENEYKNQQLQDTQNDNNEIRISKWEPIIIMADKAKNKLYEKESVNNNPINENDIKQINNMFNTIEKQEKQENILAKAYITDDTDLKEEEEENTMFKYPINDSDNDTDDN